MPRMLSGAFSGSLILVLALGALQACEGEGAERTSAPGPGTETALSACHGAIPDSALDALGWTPTSEATLDAGTCTRQADGGDVAVERRPVAAGGDDLPAAARATFTEHCADLYGETGEDVDWLGADTPACALVAAKTPGLSVLVVLTDQDTVIEARVSSADGTADTSAEDVQRALVELVRAGAAAF